MLLEARSCSPSFCVAIFFSLKRNQADLRSVLCLGLWRVVIIIEGNVLGVRVSIDFMSLCSIGNGHIVFAFGFIYIRIKNDNTRMPDRPPN